MPNPNALIPNRLHRHRFAGGLLALGVLLLACEKDEPQERPDAMVPAPARGTDAATKPPADAAAKQDIDAPPGPPVDAWALDAPVESDGSAAGQDGGGAETRDATNEVPATSPDTQGDLGPAACGGSGQACCPGNRCAASNGGLGCCLDGICLLPGESCKVVPATCFAAVCGGLCGGVNLPCCPGDQCTSPLATCDADTKRCVPCGQQDQPCCRDDTCDEALSCRNGTCQ